MSSIRNSNLIETIMKRNVLIIRLIKRCHLGEDIPNYLCYQLNMINLIENRGDGDVAGRVAQMKEK
jgi:hypothetical protein